ncbi:MAG: integration host factor subunit alpha [Desulfomonilia bacterium]
MLFEDDIWNGTLHIENIAINNEAWYTYYRHNEDISFLRGDRMTLTKKEIIEDILTNTALDKKTATEGLETFFEIIKSNLSNGEDVGFSGFGKFHVREKRARRGRNPKTGEEVTISPRHAITFSLSTALRAKLDDSDEK